MSKLILPRRKLITGLAAGLICAPAIVRAGTIPLLGAGKSPAAAGLGLQTNCTAFWEFENTGWTDATGNGTTLTATGSPTSSNTAPALVGNYSAYSGSAYLSAASNSNITTSNGSFSAQMWIYTTSPMGSVAFGKGAGGFGNQEWSLGIRFSGSNLWSFTHYDSSSTVTNADDSTTFATSTWVHLVATYNSATKGMVLYRNATSVGTNTAANQVNSTANALSVGQSSFGGGGVPSGTRIDQCGFWKGRILSAGDVTALYNSGAGLSWAAML